MVVANVPLLARLEGRGVSRAAEAGQLSDEWVLKPSPIEVAGSEPKFLVVLDNVTKSPGASGPSLKATFDDGRD